jgi:hypothetical protein
MRKKLKGGTAFKRRPETVLYDIDRLQDVISATPTLPFQYLETKLVLVFVSKMIKVTFFRLKLSFTIY